MARRVIGLTVERRLVVVPVADVTGCIIPEEADCCPDGAVPEPPEPACFTECDRCSLGMSNTWEITVGEDPEPATVYRVTDPDDGNACRFASLDLRWDLRFDVTEDVWVLTRDMGTAAETVWVLAVLDCHDENEFAPADEADGLAIVEPALPCLPEPGTDCETAPTITAGTTYGPFTLTGAGEHWFKVTTAGGAHKVTVVVSDIDLPLLVPEAHGGVALEDGACGTTSVVSDDTFTDPGTFCVGASVAAGDAWAVVSATADTVVTYTVTVEAGSC